MTYSGVIMLVACLAVARVMFRRRERVWAALILPAVLVALTIAATKAALVAMFFMHLKGEKPAVFWSLGLTAFLFVALIAFVFWTEADHLFGTRFTDAFGGLQP